MKFSPSWTIVAVALGAIAVWPFVVHHDADRARAASLPTPAPVKADYGFRDKLIAFWEGATNEHHPNDFISPENLSQQYLQRYRERGDIGDVLRAEHAAQVALKIAPVNIGAIMALSSVDLTLHRFHDALTLVHRAEKLAPDMPLLAVNEASLELEIGNYDTARALIARVQRDPHNARAAEVVDSRLLEETGHLAEARSILARASAYANAMYDNSAQSRSWYYFRQGEMAFEAGENDAAIDDEHQALAIFPNYVEATRALARFECALERWDACLADAQQSANVTPYPETLGFEADAYRATNRPADAAATDDLIDAVDRIGNAQHVSDRLLAVYWSEHRMHPGKAYAIAKRELLARDDINTDDTLAWAAAMDGRWDEAKTRIARAVRFDTEDARMQYHAGVIALHFGMRGEAERRLRRALALNPHFQAAGAADAQRLLNAL